MRVPLLAVTALSLTVLACQSAPTRQVVKVDPAKREALFSAISSMQGRWQGDGPDGNPAFSVFEVTSGAAPCAS